jgi:hypothetical protein
MLLKIIKYMGENMTKAEMFNYTRINAGGLLIQPPRKPAVSATNKGKSIPLHAWTGPEGSRRLRLPNFKTIGT